MAEYAIEMTEEAKADLDFYPVAARRTIVSAIRLQLMHEPLYRVFYDVQQQTYTVAVTSVGHKEHNVLLVRGRQVLL
jgi:hypothetical protein